MFTILSKLPQKGCHWCDDCTNTKPNTILNNSQYQETKLKTKPNTIPSNTKQYTIPNQTQYQAIPNSIFQVWLCFACSAPASRLNAWSGHSVTIYIVVERCT